MSVDFKGRPAKRESVALARITEPNLVSARGAAVLPDMTPGITTGALEAALLTFLQAKTPVSVVPLDRRIFLTIGESAEYSGLPVAFLRRLIASGKLKALKTGAGWRISRTAIEGLAGTLTDAREELTEHQLRDMELNSRRRREG